MIKLIRNVTFAFAALGILSVVSTTTKTTFGELQVPQHLLLLGQLPLGLPRQLLPRRVLPALQLESPLELARPPLARPLQLAQPLNPLLALLLQAGPTSFSSSSKPH